MEKSTVKNKPIILSRFTRKRRFDAFKSVYNHSDLEMKEVLKIRNNVLEHISETASDYSRKVVEVITPSYLINYPKFVIDIDRTGHNTLVVINNFFKTEDNEITGAITYRQKNSVYSSYSFFNGRVEATVAYYGDNKEEYDALKKAVRTVSLDKCKRQDIDIEGNLKLPFEWQYSETEPLKIWKI